MNKTSVYAEKRAKFLKAKEELDKWREQIDLIHKGETAISDVDPVIVAKMANFIAAWYGTAELWFPEEKVG